MPFRTTWHVWNPVNNRILTISTGFTLPETSSLHLKMDDWKTSLVSFWEKLGLFSGANLMLVSGRVFVFMSLQKISAFTSDQTHHGLHLSKVILQQPSSQNNFDLIWQKNTRHVFYQMVVSKKSWIYYKARPCFCFFHHHWFLALFSWVLALGGKFWRLKLPS